jgi:hypothetical protein
LTVTDADPLGIGNPDYDGPGSPRAGAVSFGRWRLWSWIMSRVALHREAMKNPPDAVIERVLPRK